MALSKLIIPAQLCMGLLAHAAPNDTTHDHNDYTYLVSSRFSYWLFCFHSLIESTFMRF